MVNQLNITPVLLIILDGWGHNMLVYLKNKWEILK